MDIASSKALICGWISVALSVMLLIARSGSFRPVPVMTQTTLSEEKSLPSFESFINPARDAEEAGSPNIPSSEANNLYASKISSSVTLSIIPLESSLAVMALSQLAGLPILIAEAIVCGCSTGWPNTIGAAPAA